MYRHPPDIRDYSIDNGMEVVHSNMYWEGYYDGRDGNPCLSPYTPGSEAHDDYIAGWREYKMNVERPDF